MGFRPQGPAPKKVPETDAIFAHVRAARDPAANEPDTLRVSLDTKAEVKVGDFARGGVARSATPVKAVDHDLAPDAVLVPFGPLERNRGATPIHQPLCVCGHSRETSDVIADSLERWWDERKVLYPGIRRIPIELDHGPEVSSSRTQVMKRLVDFVGRHQVEVRLVYLPPYHSKYNPSERCWGVLEQPGNGALLSPVAAVLGWAETMTWRGIHPVVREIPTTDERGVRLTKSLFRPIARRLIRSDTLPTWSLSIPPGSG